VHQIGVMLTPKDVAPPMSAARRLTSSKRRSTITRQKASVTQVAHYKIIRFGFQEFVKFQINPAHPEAVTFEPFD
jgi:hypothetical protein